MYRAAMANIMTGIPEAKAAPHAAARRFVRPALLYEVRERESGGVTGAEQSFAEGLAPAGLRQAPKIGEHRAEAPARKRKPAP